MAGRRKKDDEPDGRVGAPDLVTIETPYTREVARLLTSRARELDLPAHVVEVAHVGNKVAFVVPAELELTVRDELDKLHDDLDAAQESTVPDDEPADDSESGEQTAPAGGELEQQQIE